MPFNLCNSKADGNKQPLKVPCNVEACLCIRCAIIHCEFSILSFSSLNNNNHGPG